ncbi:XkdQ/YqbQ family protein [Brevibacillus sp. SYSU BS000544]|uniref:XkdQ/YqbQ family protein n=1 Tax=Brevibacillus sp. SYSU BS000544 TaxID=3416443 RepID=UPI003CE4B04A
MIQVLVVTKNKTMDITDTVESVDWSGAKTKAPRQVSVNIIYTDRGMHETVQVSNGNGIILRKDDVELFRGIVFSSNFTRSHQSIVAYDTLIYLTNNKDTYLFTGKKASDITKKICSDFSIQTGDIKNTGHVIPYLLFDGDTLYDMVMKALHITYQHSGKRYALFSKEGKLHLIPRTENIRKWVIESGVNLVDYTFSKSIENTVTKVKLEAGEEKKTIIVTAENKSLLEQFGVLQHYEKVSEKINRAQLQERANQILAKEGKEKQSFKLSNILGIPDVITGTSIYVIVPELGIKRAYYVEEDSHSFKGKKHTMSLTLSESDDIAAVK